MASVLSDYLPKIDQRITDYHIILVFLLCYVPNDLYLSVVVKLCLNIFCDHVSQFLID